MFLLTTLADLDKALRERKKPVVLFKHSTRCPVSAAADAEYRSFIKAHPDAALYTHLDLIAHRDLSNAIAQRLAVTHESPQAIVMRDGKVSAVLNHGDITAEALEDELA